jgi:peptidoglycan/xylan/chitin deacetylase (PgdA/CDA1 family)
LAAAGLAACGAPDLGSGSSTGTGPASTSTPPTSGAAGAAGATNPAGPSSSAAASSTTAPSTGPARLVVKGPDQGNRVALTFHTNGPLDQVRAVLDVAEKYKAPITAFVIGNWLDANPTMARRLLDGGHELGNHTWSHPNFLSLTPAQMTSEITRCRDALTKIAGTPGRWFRPSGTDDGTAALPASVLAAAGAAGYRVVAGFDVDPLDYQDPGAKAVTDRTLAAVRPGSIISLHMGHRGTIDAMSSLLDGLSRKNLTPVTLSALVGPD